MCLNSAVPFRRERGVRARENGWRVIPRGRRLCPWLRSPLCVELACDSQCACRLPVLHRPLLRLSLGGVVLRCKDWLFKPPSLQRSQRLHLVAKEQTDHVEGKTPWLETVSCLPRRSIACDSRCMGANLGMEGLWRRVRWRKEQQAGVTKPETDPGLDHV